MAAEEQGSLVQVELPVKCAEHDVRLQYESAEAKLQNGVLMVFVKAQPHQSIGGLCSKGFGSAIRVPS